MQLRKELIANFASYPYLFHELPENEYNAIYQFFLDITHNQKLDAFESGTLAAEFLTQQKLNLSRIIQQFYFEKK